MKLCYHGSVARDLKHIYSPRLAPDGHGGLWLTSNSPSQPVNDIVHYTGGHWIRQLAPTVPGSTGEAGWPDPHPRHHLGLGDRPADGHRQQGTQADIIKYGP